MKHKGKPKFMCSSLTDAIVNKKNALNLIGCLDNRAPKPHDRAMRMLPTSCQVASNGMHTQKVEMYEQAC